MVIDVLLPVWVSLRRCWLCVASVDDIQQAAQVPCKHITAQSSVVLRALLRMVCVVLLPVMVALWRCWLIVALRMRPCSCHVPCKHITAQSLVVHGLCCVAAGHGSPD